MNAGGGGRGGKSAHASDPAQPLGDTSVPTVPFAAITVGGGVGGNGQLLGSKKGGLEPEHVTKMQDKIEALESALKKHDGDNDGKVSYAEFHAALQEVSRKFRLHLGDSEVTELFRDYDRASESRIDFRPLVAKAKTGSFPEILRPRKERASQQAPPWVWGQ